MGLKVNHMTSALEAYFMNHNISVTGQKMFGNGMLILHTNAGEFRFNFKTNDLQKYVGQNKWRSVYNEETYEQTRLDLGMIL